MVGIRILCAFPAAILRGLTRDPTAAFFIVLLPVTIITIIGVAFGGEARLEIGYASGARGALSDAVLDGLEGDPTVRVTTYDDVDALRGAVKRKDVAAGLFVPADADARVASGEEVPLPVILQTSDAQALAAYISLRMTVAPINGRAVATAVLTEQQGGDWTENLAEVQRIAGDVPPGVEVRDVTAGSDVTLNRFSLSAPQNLVLFVFLNAMTSAAFLVTARRNGVLQRALATRATPAALMGGMALSILAVTLVQSLLIVAAGALVFDVQWGDPGAAVLLILAIDLAAASLGVLVGCVGRDADQTGALAPIVGIITAVLGGCIVPLEIFPDAMITVGRIVPQYWAMTAWQQLVFDGGELGDVLLNVVVLLAIGLVAMGASVFLLDRETRS